MFFHHPLLRLCLLNPMPRTPIYLTFIYVGGGLYVSEKNKLLSGGYIIRLQQQQQHKNRIYQSREIDATDERNKTKKSYNLDMFLFFQNDIRSRQGNWVLFISLKCD